jgi:hypothetical protein
LPPGRVTWIVTVTGGLDTLGGTFSFVPVADRAVNAGFGKVAGDAVIGPPRA